MGFMELCEKFVGPSRWLSLILTALTLFGAGDSLWAAVDTTKPIAKVNGRSITERDLRAALISLNEFQRDSMLKNEATRGELIGRLIDQEVLAQEGEKQKIDQSQEFKDLMESFRKQALSSLVLQKKLAGKVSAQSTKQYFEENKNRYSTDQIRVQHILLASKDEANKILALAKNPKSDFQALAEKYSKDPSAKNNRGDVGFITRDQFTPDFTEAAFLTRTGQVTGPIKTTFGWHLIKVVDRRSGKVPGFEEVELRVRTDYMAKVAKEEIDNLKSGSKIER